MHPGITTRMAVALALVGLAVALGFLVAAADRSGRDALLLGLVVAASVLILALLVGYFTWGVVRPVQRLAAASRRAAEGDLGVRVPEGGIGEAAELTAGFNAMLAARERAAHELERQRYELAAVLDAAAEGIAMADRQGAIVFANGRMDALWRELGVPEKGSVWSRLAGLAQLTGQAEAYAPALQLAGDPEGVFEDDFELPELQRAFHGYTAPVRGEGGEVIGRIFSLRETTRERAAEHAKEEFLATMSHELRTPLTRIRGFVELLRHGEVGELTREQARFLGLVGRSAEQLERLVDDLILVARTREWTLELELADVDLAEVAEESVEAARIEAEEKRVALEARVEPGIFLRADPRRLAQLATSLIGNAVKFTPQGGRIEVRARREEGAAVLEVSDTGLGIPLAEQERLFERFFRATAATAAHMPGSGLGLAIAREIAEAHGGTISVRSTEGEGTTFRVELPLEAQR